ncbi:hypothetical protein D3C78_1859680 [compost metagenome]
MQAELLEQRDQYDEQAHASYDRDGAAQPEVSGGHGRGVTDLLADCELVAKLVDRLLVHASILVMV